jgi:hypothetical protein
VNRFGSSLVSTSKRLMAGRRLGINQRLQASTIGGRCIEIPLRTRQSHHRRSTPDNGSVYR